MNFPWVICMSRQDATVVASLRLQPGLEVAEQRDTLWLRGPRGDDPLDLKLAALPAHGRFELIGANRLRRIDQHVPSAELPALSWQPLSAWFRAALPPSMLPGNPPAGVTLRLERSTLEQEPEILLTTLEAWGQFTQQTAQIRLERLQFAADHDRQVIVRGKPLPPLPGKRFVLHGGIAVAAGFHWKPAVSTDVLAQRLGVSGDALVLWNEDETVTRFHTEQFVPATRSAVRATVESLANDR
jgi:hypothetical protein